MELLAAMRLKSGTSSETELVPGETHKWRQEDGELQVPEESRMWSLVRCRGRASTLLDWAPEHMLEPFANVRHWGEEQTWRRAQSAWRLCVSVALGEQARLETWMWA